MSIDDREPARARHRIEPALPVSRRTLMKTAAGAGAAAAAIGIVGVAHARSTGPAEAALAGAPLSVGDMPKGTGPIVAHVSNLDDGTVEIFTDGTRTEVRDRDLASRIARAATR